MGWYRWAQVGTCHAMGGHRWAQVVVDGCGMGMGTNSKEMLGSNEDPCNISQVLTFHVVAICGKIPWVQDTSGCSTKYCPLTNTKLLLVAHCSHDTTP